jgi:hypothetical protein
VERLAQCFQLPVGEEGGRFQPLGDTVVAAFDPPVGLGVVGIDRSVVDAVLGAGLIEEVSASRLALASSAEMIGQLFFNVRQRGRDAKRVLGVEAFQGLGSSIRCVVRLNLAEGLVSRQSSIDG